MKVACLWFSRPVPMQQLAENCLRLSPQICFRGEEALFIEYEKCKKIYSEEGFFVRLQVILRRMKLSGRVAVGSDVPDSLVLAKYMGHSVDQLPLEALLDLADPFNKDPIARGYIHKMNSAFCDLGIKDIAGFKKVPLSDLISRFGAIAVLCHQRARGEFTVAWPRWKPEEIIFERTDFPYFEFYGELSPILFELKKQLDLIFQRLWARELKAQTLQVRIYCETNSLNPEPFKNFDFDFLFAQNTTKGALNIIKERLAKDFEKSPILTPIEALSTQVIATAPHITGQKNFFHNQEETAEKIHILLSQLNEVHGKEKIFHAALTEDRRPERSWQKIIHQTDNKLKTIQINEKIPPRPTYLIRPEKIEVRAGFIFIRRKPFRISKWSENFERITGGWAEESNLNLENQHLQNSFDRNYYQVELETGTVLTIFQTPAQSYYLHGYFG